MFTRQDRLKIFNQKKKKVERRTNKEGIITEKVIPGFENTTFEQFEEWFDETTFNQGCNYCGTTNHRSLELYQMQRAGLRPDATRGGKRGKRLELDRVDPRQPYDNLQNLVWCCYWCNNAKSNFFTAEEFKPIAVAMRAALSAI
ncbi:hypothetical protein I5M27_08690 [Adhaeribacter sp. BT258]|uniref:HNH endonuclease n=1 Tax=Adhaeribacter terrigena TaxID=2793070 RepID=A0ABS1C0W9_9BACT|nr:hypothetical protein [Adhaeribacter terrigena]MBK0403062.1 hypothetical protein [Adhaeribacter terrigena]